ncbi:MAG: diacylglycerol kinase family protein [Planctomycetota bacterium]
MKAIVLLNGTAGRLAIPNHQRDSPVKEALAAAGIVAEVRTVTGDNLHAEASLALQSKIDVLIVGGGDGTLSTVAGILAGQPIPLGILPLGTLNHFAKDLGIPLDLAAAVKVIAGHHVIKVDVGELNGRVFINNSSLGIYPYMVLDRESQRKRHGFSKWKAMLFAMFKIFRRFPLVEVKLSTDTASTTRKTPLVFVGNNRYHLDLFNLGKRAALDQGELSLYVAHAQTRWATIKLFVRAMCGRLQQARDFETLSLTHCTIDARRRHMHVAADGEVMRLAVPLRYSVRPGALRVCVPQLSDKSASHPRLGADEVPATKHSGQKS